MSEHAVSAFSLLVKTCLCWSRFVGQCQMRVFIFAFVFESLFRFFFFFSAFLSVLFSLSICLVPLLILSSVHLHLLSLLSVGVLETGPVNLPSPTVGATPGPPPPRARPPLEPNGLLVTFRIHLGGEGDGEGGVEGVVEGGVGRCFTGDSRAN